MRILIALIVLLIGLMAYVRLSPTDAERWHMRHRASDPYNQQDPNGFVAARRMTAPAEQVMAQIKAVAEATPRTRLIAGSVGEGLMTFETRSRIWGFPDYTTVSATDEMLILYGRLRFGQSDLGVNKLRVLAWLTTVADLTEPL